MWGACCEVSNPGCSAGCLTGGKQGRPNVPQPPGHRKTLMIHFRLFALARSGVLSGALSGMLSGVIFSGAVHAQNAPLPQAAGSRPVGAPGPQAFSAAELVKIKAILAPYKPAGLSANDAKAIKRSLRDAGFRRSRELDAALIAAGFSPDKMDILDPPPPRPPGEGVPPPPLPSPVKK